MNLDPNFIRSEVARLANEAAGDWCKEGGWQYPFDFGNGIIAPTYSSRQSMHPWRKDILINHVKQLSFNKPLKDISILDLGSGEGAMDVALWELGFRNITAVEVRAHNIEKAKFVYKVFGVEPTIVQCTTDEYFAKHFQTFDIVLCMGLLYHVTNPFDLISQAAKRCDKHFYLETVIANPNLYGFNNRHNYEPSNAGFFIRRDSAESMTAGLIDFELWPNIDAVDLLLSANHLNQVTDLTKDAEYKPLEYENKERAFIYAQK